MSEPPSDNPFEAPRKEEDVESPIPLDDVPAAETAEGPAPQEPVVELRSFPDVMTAEIARSQLVASGIAASLRDQHLAGAHPILGAVVGGVKVVVSAGDAERAAEVLALPSGSANEAYRVEQRATAIYLLFGALAGSILGAVLKALFGTFFFVLSCVAGAIVGGLLGSRKQSYCSGCLTSLPGHLDRCPGCGARFVGVLDDPEERLAAEERRVGRRPPEGA